MIFMVENVEKKTEDRQHVSPECRCLPTYPPTHPLTHSLNHSLTHSLTQSLTHSLTHSLTQSLTPWSRVLLEKLTSLQLVKKFPAFYGTWRYITALTSACHLSLSWTSCIQSLPPHPTPWRSILILSSHLRLGLPSGLRMLIPICQMTEHHNCHLVCVV